MDCSTPVPCQSLFPGAYSLISIELVMPSNHLILCHPLLLLPSSSHRFTTETISVTPTALTKEKKRKEKRKKELSRLRTSESI